MGWKSETSEELFSETVTTVAGDIGNEATLSYSDLITADTLKVTFNGVEYTCPKISGSGYVGYGGVGEPGEGDDFTEFPFVIYSSDSGNFIYTESAGTYTVSASADVTTYTDAFKEGVHKNVLKEVESESDADIVVLIPLILDQLPTVTKNCLKLSTTGNPTSYTQTQLFATDRIVLYKIDQYAFANDQFKYELNSLNKTARCYYGTSSAEPDTTAFRIESDATLDAVSDYYEIKYYSYGLQDALNAYDADTGGGGSDIS